MHPGNHTYTRASLPSSPAPVDFHIHTQVRKFVAEQYTVAGLHLHPSMVPKEVKRQEDGRLSLVMQVGGWVDGWVGGWVSTRARLGRAAELRGHGVAWARIRPGRQAYEPA